MQSTPLVRFILRDEALTRGLGDVEARILIEWLVDRADGLAAEGANSPVRQRLRAAGKL